VRHSQRRPAAGQQPLQRWTHIAAVVSAITGVVALFYAGLSFGASQQQARAVANGQISARLAAATENLTAEGAASREAAIGELGRIAHESPRHQPEAMTLLASFVRRQTRPTGPLGRPACLDQALPADVATALTVIGARDPSHDGDVPINLSSSCLNHAGLNGANLTCVNLDASHLEDANLERAILLGTWLSGARMAGANLYEAKLNHARMDHAIFYTARKEGALLERADLSDTILTDADVRWSYLGEADLVRTQIVGANFRGSDLTGAGLATYLDGADFSDAVGVNRSAALRRMPTPRPGPCD